MSVQFSLDSLTTPQEAAEMMRTIADAHNDPQQLARGIHMLCRVARQSGFKDVADIFEKHVLRVQEPIVEDKRKR